MNTTDIDSNNFNIYNSTGGSKRMNFTTSLFELFNLSTCSIDATNFKIFNSGGSNEKL